MITAQNVNLKARATLPRLKNNFNPSTCRVFSWCYSPVNITWPCLALTIIVSWDEKCTLIVGKNSENAKTMAQNKHAFCRLKINYRKCNWPIIGLQIWKTVYVLFTKQSRIPKKAKDQFLTQIIFGPLLDPQLKLLLPKSAGISSQISMFAFLIILVRNWKKGSQ